MQANLSSDRKAGYDACRRWMLEQATERERSYLAAMFGGGFFQVDLPPSTSGSLAVLLRSHYEPGSYVVDFGSSAWLVGFRQAVIEDTTDPG